MGFKIPIKHELTLEEVHEKMNWGQVFRHYFPSITDNEIDFLLFEHTCYPMDSAKSLHQVYDIYLERVRIAKTLI